MKGKNIKPNKKAVAAKVIMPKHVQENNENNILEIETNLQETKKVQTPDTIY